MPEAEILSAPPAESAWHILDVMRRGKGHPRKAAEDARLARLGHKISKPESLRKKAREGQSESDRVRENRRARWGLSLNLGPRRLITDRDEYRRHREHARRALMGTRARSMWDFIR